MTTLSVVIPAYNEERGIAEIAARVLSVRGKLTQAGIEALELLVVDDGSRDRTAQVAGSIDGVTLIQHPKNRGYGAALKTGFAKSTGDLIGFLDADGTYPPEWFPELCREAMNGSDLVIGSRMSGTESKMPATRRLGNFLFANLLSFLGPQRVTDSASGMRVFKREILERIYPLPDGLNLTPVMSVRALHEGIVMSEIPIPYAERVGASKLSVVHDGALFLQSIVWTVMGYNPVRVLGAVGLASLGMAALIGIGLIVTRLQGVTSLSPLAVTALYASMVLSVGGVSLFNLGATFNYIVGLFHTSDVPQGLFTRPILKVPVERHFGWIGALLVVLGVGIAVLSLVLGARGWEIERIWLYLLGAAMSLLTGLQMVISWFLVRVLGDLSERDMLVAADLNGV